MKDLVFRRGRGYGTSGLKFRELTFFATVRAPRKTRGHIQAISDWSDVVQFFVEEGNDLKRGDILSVSVKLVGTDAD